MMNAADEREEGGISIVCRVCGLANPVGRRFCSGCWTALADGTEVSAGEIERRLAKERRARRRRRAIALAAVLVVAVAAAVQAYRGTRPVPPLAPATTAVDSASSSGRWTMAGHDARNSRYAPQGREFAGRVKWTFQTTAPFLASPVATDAVVYAPTGDGRVVALDAATGAVRWQVRVSGPVDSSPALAGDTLYVGLRDGRLLALDAGTGAILWTYDAGGPITAALAVSGGEVYAGAGDGRLHVLDAANGALRWRSDKGSWVQRAPAIIGDYVAVAAASKTRVYDRRTGAKAVEFQTGNDVSTDPVASGSELYLGDSRGTLWVVDLNWRRAWWDRGAIRFSWMQLYLWGMAPLPPFGFSWVRAYGGGVMAPMALTDDALYFGGFRGAVTAVDRTSHEARWTFQAGTALQGAATIAGRTLYIGGADGSLLALNSDTGELRWRFAAGGAITTGPAITDNAIYVAAGDGTLYALE